MTIPGARLDGARVVILLPSLELGGAERQALLLARQLKHERGMTVEMWAFRGPGPLEAACHAASIPCRYFFTAWPETRSRLIWELVRAARALRRAGPDVVLPFANVPNVLAGLTWRWSGASACIWNQRDEGLNALPPIVERLAARRTRDFVSNSTQGAEFLTRALSVRPERILVVPNGVELSPPEMSADAWRAQLRAVTGQPLACMLANLHRLKDHATLIRAWRQVVDDSPGPPPLLFLAGLPGATHAALVAQVQDLDLRDEVRFLGQVRDVTGLLSAMDLGVFSSFSEGCPNAVLEYMAMGLPVAGTDHPGIRQAVGIDGLPYLAPPRDPGALAERILDLLRHPTLRARLGRANQERIAREFSVDGMAEAMVRLMARALGRTASA